MSPDQFAVALTPLPTAARVAKHRSALRWRMISAVISLAILLVIIFVLDLGMSQGWLITVLVLWAVSTAVWLTITFLALNRAKKDLASIAHGDAIVIDRQGLTFLHPDERRAAWGEITALKIAGSSFGAGPSLVMETSNQPAARIPISFLDALPSAIDSAVTAHSLGRVRLDVSEMDRMI